MNRLLFLYRNYETAVNFLADFEIYIFVVVNLKLFAFRCLYLHESSGVNDRHESQAIG